MDWSSATQPASLTRRGRCTTYCVRTTPPSGNTQRSGSTCGLYYCGNSAKCPGRERSLSEQGLWRHFLSIVHKASDRAGTGYTEHSPKYSTLSCCCCFFFVFFFIFFLQFWYLIYHIIMVLIHVPIYIYLQGWRRKSCTICWTYTRLTARRKFQSCDIYIKFDRQSIIHFYVINNDLYVYVSFNW